SRAAWVRSSGPDEHRRPGVLRRRARPPRHGAEGRRPGRTRLLAVRQPAHRPLPRRRRVPGGADAERRHRRERAVHLQRHRAARRAAALLGTGRRRRGPARARLRVGLGRRAGRPAHRHRQPRRRVARPRRRRRQGRHAAARARRRVRAARRRPARLAARARRVRGDQQRAVLRDDPHGAAPARPRRAVRRAHRRPRPLAAVRARAAHRLRRAVLDVPAARRPHGLPRRVHGDHRVHDGVPGARAGQVVPRGARPVSRSAGPLADVALVVVSYGSSALLAANLPRTVGDSGVRVVVVDSYSGDAERAAVTRLAAEHGWDLLTPGTNTGFGGGSNLGAAHALAAGARVLVLLNPDAWTDPDGLAALAAAARAPDPVLVAPRILRPDGGVYSRGLTYLSPRDGTMSGRRRDPDDVPWLSGACLALGAQLWTAL